MTSANINGKAPQGDIMDFYTALSRHYDEIFPATQEDMAFIRQKVAGARRLLDIGCGTGNKTELLVGEGQHIIGIDSDEAMIDLAQKTHSPAGTSYKVMDMEKLDTAFTKASPDLFDAVLCLGNTLVHLTSYERIAACIKNIRQKMKYGGIFCVQILNYDLILDKPFYNLPLLETQHLSFKRWYEPDGELLNFHAELFLKEEQETLQNCTPLYPLRPAALCHAFQQGGFGNIEHYGGFAGQPESPESMVTIVFGTAL